MEKGSGILILVRQGLPEDGSEVREERPAGPEQRMKAKMRNVVGD